MNERGKILLATVRLTGSLARALRETSFVRTFDSADPDSRMPVDRVVLGLILQGFFELDHNHYRWKVVRPSLPRRQFPQSHVASRQYIVTLHALTTRQDWITVVKVEHLEGPRPQYRLEASDDGR